jgi:PAS domain S-box-containing protein
MTFPLDLDIPLFLEGIPHPSMILDRSFGVVAMNRLMEALTGYSTKLVAGIHGELVVRSNTGNTRGQLFSRVMRSAEPLSVTGDVINSNRRKVPIQYTISLLCERDGSRCGLLVIAEDLSARKNDRASSAIDFDTIELIGHSPKMQKVFDMIPLLARTDASVMITGETGTGKDKVAEIIHHHSVRARFPFIKINCGALPPGLLESELFGHVKGAFTGATRNKQGMFQLADKGTLFLTEIGDMPLPLQIKLLSVLDDQEFVPVGGEASIKVDVRIIAATNRPLRQHVAKRKFREDLFYRLNVLHVHLPPLREREGDIRYLLDHFLQRFGKSLNRTGLTIAKSAMQKLLDYPYPGNIRELSNIIEYGVNICNNNQIRLNHLPPSLLELQPPAPTAAAESEDDEKSPEPSPFQGQDLKTAVAGEPKWTDIERDMIIESLKKHHGNRTRTAESLGWGRMKLWRKMKKHRLQD